jgi:hypothetical protein
MAAPAVAALARVVLVEATAWGLQETIEDYIASTSDLERFSAADARAQMMARAAQEICDRGLSFSEFVGALEILKDSVKEWPLGLHIIANAIPDPSRALYAELQTQGGCVKEYEMTTGAPGTATSELAQKPNGALVLAQKKSPLANPVIVIPGAILVGVLLARLLAR